jgi:hypothetical protein
MAKIFPSNLFSLLLTRVVSREISNLFSLWSSDAASQEGSPASCSRSMWVAGLVGDYGGRRSAGVASSSGGSPPSASPLRVQLHPCCTSSSLSHSKPGSFPARLHPTPIAPPPLHASPPFPTAEMQRRDAAANSRPGSEEVELPMYPSRREVQARPGSQRATPWASSMAAPYSMISSSYLLCIDSLFRFLWPRFDSISLYSLFSISNSPYLFNIHRV